MAYDAIVAGAGLWGCTLARRLAESGSRVLVLEKRKAVGGNCRCRIEKGIEVHLYGSHIFHTSNEEVWRFVNRFVTFNDYRHSVLANHGGKIYHLPIGKTLLQEFFGEDMKSQDMKEYLARPSTSTSASTSRTKGDELFDAFIRGYTSKQWGVAPEAVDPSVIARLKVRDTYSTDYFDDPYQGIPMEGFNELFLRMLDHPNVRVKCNSPFELSSIPHSPFPIPVYYSGPIDALFNYRFGYLPWRTLRFETEHLPRRDFQGTTVVNYSDVSVPYTRIHEFRHYHPEARGAFAKPQGTVITREYSSAWKPGDEPYYPIDNDDSRALLAKYQTEAAKYPNLIVGGRLGAYRYYDMDKSIAAALAVKID